VVVRLIGPHTNPTNFIVTFSADHVGTATIFLEKHTAIGTGPRVENFAEVSFKTFERRNFEKLCVLQAVYPLGIALAALKELVAGN
jgi:hypothetical protein